MFSRRSATEELETSREELQSILPYRTLDDRIRGGPVFHRHHRAQACRRAAHVGWGQESDMRQTKAAGFDAHLTKPLDIQQLERLIDELVAKRRGIAP